MAQDPPAQDLMNYEAMAQDALRGVAKAALKRAAAPDGAPLLQKLHEALSPEARAPAAAATRAATRRRAAKNS